MILYDNFVIMQQCEEQYKMFLQLNSEYVTINEMAAPFNKVIENTKLNFEVIFNLLQCSPEDLKNISDTSPEGKALNKVVAKFAKQLKFLLKPAKLLVSSTNNSLELNMHSIIIGITFNNLTIKTTEIHKGVMFEKTYDLKQDANNKDCLFVTNFIKYKTVLKNVSGADYLVIDFATNNIICVYNKSDKFVYFNNGKNAYVVNGFSGAELANTLITYNDEYNNNLENLNVIKELNNNEIEEVNNIVLQYLHGLIN